MFNKLGLHSCNVAPEFGIKETEKFLQLLIEYKLYDEYDNFLGLKDLHKVYKKVGPSKTPIVLPPEILKKLMENTWEFWRNA